MKSRKLCLLKWNVVPDVFFGKNARKEEIVLLREKSGSSTETKIKPIPADTLAFLNVREGDFEFLIRSLLLVSFSKNLVIRFLLENLHLQKNEQQYIHILLSFEKVYRASIIIKTTLV